MYALADLQLRLLQPLGPWHTKHGKAATAIHRPTSSLQKSQATRPGPIRKLWGSARVGLEVHGKVAWGMSHRYHTDPMGEPHRGGLAGERPWSKICYSESQKNIQVHMHTEIHAKHISDLHMHICLISVRGFIIQMPGLDEGRRHIIIHNLMHRLLTKCSFWLIGVREECAHDWLFMKCFLILVATSLLLLVIQHGTGTQSKTAQDELCKTTLHIYIHIYQTTSKTLCSTL